MSISSISSSYFSAQGNTIAPAKVGGENDGDENTENATQRAQEVSNGTSTRSYGASLGQNVNLTA